MKNTLSKSHPVHFPNQLLYSAAFSYSYTFEIKKKKSNGRRLNRRDKGGFMGDIGMLKVVLRLVSGKQQSHQQEESEENNYALF